MRPILRLLVVAPVLALPGLVVPTHAAADDEGGAGGTARAYVDEAGSPTATARSAAANTGRPSRSGSTRTCDWTVAVEDDRTFSVYLLTGDRRFSRTGRWLWRKCTEGQSGVEDLRLVPEGGEGVAPAALAAEASKSIQIPPPPMATSPEANRRLFVRVPTWLWIDQAWWHAYSATADAGGVTATVSARPVRAVWSAGDGGSTTCTGPGVAWRPGMREDATYCSYVYRNSSSGQPGGTYTLSVNVEFEVNWTSSTGAAGSLGRITRSASRAVQVGEIQAIETD